MLIPHVTAMRTRPGIFTIFVQNPTDEGDKLE